MKKKNTKNERYSKEIAKYLDEVFKNAVKDKRLDGGIRYLFITGFGTAFLGSILDFHFVSEELTQVSQSAVSMALITSFMILNIIFSDKKVKRPKEFKHMPPYLFHILILCGVMISIISFMTHDTLCVVKSIKLKIDIISLVCIIVSFSHMLMFFILHLRDKIDPIIYKLSDYVYFTLALLAVFIKVYELNFEASNPHLDRIAIIFAALAIAIRFVKITGEVAKIHKVIK